MKLKTARKISDVIYLVEIGLVMMFFILKQYRTFISAAIFAVLLVYFLFSLKFMRCPHCGKRIRRYDEKCRHCGRSVDAEPKIRNQKKKF